MNDRDQHDLYRQAEQFAPAIARLARAMERDADRARDLEQDIHCELFRSFARFDGRCALKTWVYRVAHNVAADHRLRESRQAAVMPLDAMDELASGEDAEAASAEALTVERAHTLIRSLPTLDAQIMLLWLEGESAKDTAEITGLSPGSVATRIHRIKHAIASQFEPEHMQETQR